MSAPTPLTPEFREACRDYRYLLDHRYPVKACVKLVGDRYRLTGLQRSVLRRGVSASEEAQARRGKAIGPTETRGADLVVDAYNVLITIGSYLSGKFTYLATDGFLRDAAESQGAARKKNLTGRAMSIVLDYAVGSGIGSLHWVIDAPVSFSRDLAHDIRERMTQMGMRGNAETVQSADRVVVSAERAIPATSDSAIVDAREAAFDLARWALEARFGGPFTDLKEFLRAS